MKTTLEKIREQKPCANGWEKLLRFLGKTNADDEPLSIATVLESNGLDEALWCLRAVDGHEREIRLFAVWCANQVRHLMTDKRSKNALKVAYRFANGLVTREELEAARAAAWAADNDAASDVAMAAAWSARAAARAASSEARAAARDAAWSAAMAASDVAWAKQEAEFKRMLDCIENGVIYEIEMESNND